jgi:hypothetical protein
VNKHRSAVAAVAAVARMLCNIGVNHDAVSAWIAKALRLVGLDFAEGPPATRRAGRTPA